VDATDAKGEQIHQTLMAKKMQRLDESPDFRPFKFRIQAFTNSFLDEVSPQLLVTVIRGFIIYSFLGKDTLKKKYPRKRQANEDFGLSIILMSFKVRNYLWRQQYILRFNEDGKKAKSKGNHIWNVEAKKTGDGQWEFRPFHRKLAGTPPGVAYCGLRWCWRPRVWDPQFSFKKISVTFSSPNLPSWLSWKGSELSGTPPDNAESCQIIASAKVIAILLLANLN
jgi:hypothetical protein